MIPIHRWILPLGASLLGLVACWQCAHLRTQEGLVQSGRERSAALQAELAELHALQAASQRALSAQPPTQDLVVALQQVLAECGVPERALQQVEPEQDSVDGGQGDQSLYRTQGVRVQISPISPGDAVRLLRRWAEQQPVWTATRLELSHPTDQDANAYQLILRLHARYVADHTGATP